MNSNIIIIVGSIVVAFIFITWLVRYISGLKKTRDYYQKKISEMKGSNLSGEEKRSEDIAAEKDEERSESN